jgi:hypothetical protein
MVDQGLCRWWVGAGEGSSNMSSSNRRVITGVNCQDCTMPNTCRLLQEPTA